VSASNLQGEPQGQRVRLNQSAGRREERLEMSTVLIGRVATSEPTTRCHSADATTSAAIASGGGSSALSGSCCGTSSFSGRCPALPPRARIAVGFGRLPRTLPEQGSRVALAGQNQSGGRIVGYGLPQNGDAMRAT